MDDLVVDDELTATVVDDEGANAATALSEGVPDTAEEASLRDDGETLLDVSGLGHGDDGGVVVEVQDAVGLVDGAEHALDNNGGRGVGDEAGLFLELTVEEVDTKVTVLAGLRRHRDTDDLARTTLEDQDVADADEVAGDGDGVWGGTAARLNDANVLADAVTDARGTTLIHDDLIMVMVVVRMDDAVGGALNAATEGVVVAFVVVVAHFAGWVVVEDGVGLENFNVGTGNWFNVDLRSVVSAVRVYTRRLLDWVEGSGRLVRAVVRDVDLLSWGTGVGFYGSLRTTIVRDVDVVAGTDATTVLLLSYVELVTKALIVARSGITVAGRKSDT